MLYYFFYSDNLCKIGQMAKEGKVLEQKKLLQPFLGTPEGIHNGCIIIFSTSAPLAVYPNTQPKKIMKS